MSRYSSQGSGAVASNILSSHTSKASNYLDDLKRNHAMCKALAEKVKKFEIDLPRMTADAMSKEDAEALQEKLGLYKDKLKVVAEGNVHRERNVHSFLSALATVNSDVENAQETDERMDYNKIVSNTVATKQREADASASGTPIAEHQKFKEILVALGEVNEHTGNGAFEDDDVVLDETAGGGTNSTANLKCPISGQWMTDPVRNKQCGHAYSKLGIEQHIRIRKTTCPVSGCGNNQLSLDQLEPDNDTCMKVRRQIRREEHDAQVRASDLEYDSD